MSEAGDEDTPQLIGEILDSRGIKLTLDEEDFITDIVVVAQVVKEDGSTHVAVVESEGTDWIKTIGLLGIAKEAKLGGVG